MKWTDISIDNIGVHDLLRLWAKEKPDQNMLIFSGVNSASQQVKEYSYREIDLLSNQFANALITLGIQKGDRVAIYLPNCPEFVIAYFGIFKAGATVVPISSIYTKREVSYELIDTSAQAIITSSLFIANVDNNNCPDLNHIIMVDNNNDGSFYKLIERSLGTDPGIAWDTQNDIAMIPYTSGTTGEPKGVPHTHYHYLWDLRECARHVEFEHEGCTCTTTPLFHVTGYHDTLGVGLFCGYSAVVMERFDPVRFMELVSEYKITFALVPTPGLIYLLNVPNFEKYDVSSLKAVMSGGTAIPEQIGRAFANKFGVDLCEGYGSTEVLITHISPISRKGKVKYGSTGPNINNNTTDVVVKIVDVVDGINELSQGETGEIIIKCPSSSGGYLNKPQDTKENFRNGFWYSGDIGFFDKDGYLYITDRKKDMINVSGFKCWPREVEDVILSNPKVMDVTVIGRDDAVKGEVPVAFIQLKNEAVLDKEEIKAFLSDKLAKYKIPVDYKFLDLLPKTPQQKPDKNALKIML